MADENQISADAAEDAQDTIAFLATLGIDPDQVTEIETSGLSAITLPDTAQVDRTIRNGDDMILLQADGSALVIYGGAAKSMMVLYGVYNLPMSVLSDLATPSGAMQSLEDVASIPPFFAVNQQFALPASGYEYRVEPGDPLIGIPYNPLLPPTDYLFDRPYDEEYGGKLQEDGGLSGLAVDLAPRLVLGETDDLVLFRPADYITVSFTGTSDTDLIETVTVSIDGLPLDALATLGTLTNQGDGSATLTFTGSWDAFQTLTVTLPTDFSTTSRADFQTGALPVSYTVLGVNLEEVTETTLLTVIAEGDVDIDDTLPDTVPDETDAATIISPASLLSPAATDIDSSESLRRIELVVDGLPGGITLAELALVLPAGADASLAAAASGAAMLAVVLRAADVADVSAAYDALTFTLPADFSTANRNDLGPEDTTLPLIFRLRVQTDEDRNPLTDTAIDGTAEAVRVVEIGFEPDIILDALLLIRGREDDGTPDSAIGVTVDLGIRIAITDADGSETADPTDPRFAATVTISFDTLPDGTAVNTGTLTGQDWSGTVQEARDLALTLPGDYSGSVLSLITVTTPEGATSRLQAMVILPTEDGIVAGAIESTEIDAPLVISLSDFITVLVTDPDETLDALDFTLPGLPLGTRLVDGDGNDIGVFTDAGNGTVDLALTVISGGGIDPRDIDLILPTDYSTENPGPDLIATLDITTSQGTDSAQIPLTVHAEGDIVMADAQLLLSETDDVVRFTPSDHVAPAATDADGSESVTRVAALVNDLPDGSRVSTDGGTTWVAQTGAYFWTGTLADYTDLVIELPKDFSTANPATQLFIDVGAITDERGTALARLDVSLDFELDASVTAPARRTADEDGDGFDGGGVTIDLGIEVEVTDIDGSEDSAFVEAIFVGLPDGVTASEGTLNGSVWTGSPTEAEALALHFPGDYSGNAVASITVISPEGRDTTRQVITIRGTGDIDLSSDPIERVELDLPVLVRPANFWTAGISDSDGNLPLEDLTMITLTLTGLPAGMDVLGVPADSVTYDVLTGGDFGFTGLPDDYATLRLVFPTDFSTENRNDGILSGPITGTLLAQSTEDSTGQSIAVSLTITPEGDVAIDDSLPDTVPDEGDAPITMTPAALLLPELRDNDGSESLSSLVLTIEGLPGDVTIASLDLGLPDAAKVTLDRMSSGAQVLTVTLTADAVGDVLAVYQAISLTLPTDFSTDNRSDLGPVDTTLPLTLTLHVQTDEDRDPTTDTLIDGTATSTRIVDIGVEADISLSAPRVVTVEEDDGQIDSAIGVTADLGLEIAITDQDGSETEDPSDPRFSATVEVTFVGLPVGAAATTGTLTGRTWTGTVAEARALALELPGDYSGAILSAVQVVTPEGASTTAQILRITPTEDAVVSGDIVSVETDAPLALTLSDFISVVVTDPNEVLTELDFTLPGLPAGTRVTDGAGTDIGVFADAGGGLVDLTLVWQLGDAFVPAEVSLILPRDYSTQTPGTTLTANLQVITDQGADGADIPVFVGHEGDVRVADAVADLSETDDVVRITLADHLLPAATDADGSESITLVAALVNDLPDGARVSTDGGTSWTAQTGPYVFSGTLAAYGALQIELPKDFSTGSPETDLYVDVGALTNEDGADLGRLTITLSPEGDLEITGDGLVELDENDPLSNFDEDTTTSQPLDIRVADSWTGTATDADGSESIANIRVALNDLPTGTRLSMDGGASFATVTNPDALVLDGLSVGDYGGIVLRLPDDFSTDQDITGTVTFTTDEALLAGETDQDGTDGIESRDITIRVAPEADIRITGQDIEVIEDLGQPIPLGLSAAAVDIDGSETITPPIAVTFEDLPTNGDTVLSDGTLLTGPTDSWTGTASELDALGVARFPTHFSGIIPFTVTVVTNESDATGASKSFTLSVTPVAEPTLDLTLVTDGLDVVQTGDDQYSVDEDTSFLLSIVADTPDKDGSERLQTIVIEDLPQGWVSASAVADLSAFETGAGSITSASLSGTKLTLTLNPGLDRFEGRLRLTPLENDDRDVETILGRDVISTVTAIDTAAGLTSDTATAGDTIDIDVDAVVDPLTLTAEDINTNENTNGAKTLSLRLSDFALKDSDGSELPTKMTLVISVVTASDGYDPSDTRDLLLRVGDLDLADDVLIRQVDSASGSVTYEVTPALGSDLADVTAAVENLQILLPQYFSGRLTVDGTVDWNETQTGDVEIDTSDNFGTTSFTLINTVRPIAQASLDTAVFVLTDAEAADGSPTEIAATKDTTSDDFSIKKSQALTLLESTGDGSGPGQVTLFVRLTADVPDLDGSEQLSTIVLENVPSDWPVGLTSGGALTRSSFVTADGSGTLGVLEWAKIDTATYDATTGLVTLTFADDVTDFSAALRLQPTLYEDYDVNHKNNQPFDEAGTFFGKDLTIRVTATDTNTITTDDLKGSTRFNVDVDSVNNLGVIEVLPRGNEGVIDAAGGVWQFNFTPTIADVDGSETITGVLLQDVPFGVTVYANDPTDPTGPKIPALLTETNVPPGFNTWSLVQEQWESVELRGIPTHYAGPYPITLVIVTTEDDGGQTGTTTIADAIYIDPVVDGGNPSERVSVNEDSMVYVPLDGNLIDNPANSPESPEELFGPVIIDTVRSDSQGRIPRFFLSDATAPDGFTELFLTNGTITLTQDEAARLYVQQGQDSNETARFNVTMSYRETLDTSEQVTETGRVTVRVTGVADTPITDGQDPDPTNHTGGIADSQINAAYRPDEATDGIDNHDLVYGYAGRAFNSFALDQRVSDTALANGVTDQSVTFADATPLSGLMTEITFNGDFDGSETLYFVITDVDPDVTFVNVLPSSPTGDTYVVTEDQLATLEVFTQPAQQVTYYNMQIHAIVVEDDAVQPALSGTPDERLAQLDASIGNAVVSRDFTVVALPNQGGGQHDCEPEQELPLPQIFLTGSGPEDTDIPLTVHLTPDAFYSSLSDLVDLPNSVEGSFAFSISLPDGATLSSDPSGAVLLDPLTGDYVVDLSKLGVDGTDPTQSAGTLLFTPPEHESSPVNPFDPDETVGADDPYDNLDDLSYTMILNNVTCNTTDAGSGAFTLDIIPVADGPQITIPATSVDEDTIGTLAIEIQGIDGGERLTGDITIEVDNSNGGQLYDANGDPLNGTTSGTTTTYVVDTDDLGSLQIGAGAHFSGTVSVSVTATTEDINGDTQSATVSADIEIVPVADVPEFIYDTSVLDAETGLPFVDDSGTPTITAIEDQPFLLSSVLDADSPDPDGSEARTIILSGVPDYLLVSGPAGSGFVNNGDGSYTMSLAAYQQMTLTLKTDHARTPDALDPAIPAEIPLSLTVTTSELANSDQNEGTSDFLFRVRPDADLPTLTASVAPSSGAEDDGTVYTLSIQATTPDAHETISFEIQEMIGQTVLLDGVAQTPVGGVIAIPGQASGSSFVPAGAITLVPDADFSGDVDVTVSAVTLDTGVLFTDTDTASDTLTVSITPTGDIELSVVPVTEVETDAEVVVRPSDSWQATVTDNDGNAPIEEIDSVTLTLGDLPAGVTVAGVLPGTVSYDAAAGGSFTFTGSAAQYAQLSLSFPADFNTDTRYDGRADGPISGSLTVTSTEDAAGQSANVSITITQDADVSLTVDPAPNPAQQTGRDLTINLGIDAVIDTTIGEALTRVRVQFDDLPDGSTASDGVLLGNRLTLTRGGRTPAEFAAAIAALAITLPATFNGDLVGTVEARSTEGDADPADFSITVLPDAGVVSFASSNLAGIAPDIATAALDPIQIRNDPDMAPGGEIASDPPSALPETGTDAVSGEDHDLVKDLDGGDGTRLADASDDGSDITATDGNDIVIIDDATPYHGVDRFNLGAGDDVADLRLAQLDLVVMGGDGDDWILAGGGDDVLQGDAGADHLFGGAGRDVFRITDLSDTDTILDYNGDADGQDRDQIDLSEIVSVGLGENLDDLVGYDPETGTLSVGGVDVAIIHAAGGGFADDVELIFSNAQNVQETATV